MRKLPILVLTGLALLAAGAAGQTVQTIAIDGVNDFDAANLVDADGADTQHPQLDLGNLYLTNDANNLYLGFEHDQEGWTTVQLGVAIDVGTADGGTSDPWSRQLEWSGATTRPDFIYYINLDSNWQASYQWTGAWSPIVAGEGALGVPTDTEFREYAFSLTSLGVGFGDQVNVEVWVTQDGNTKGPLDAAANDAVQLSTPDGTQFDVDDPVPMTLFHDYTVLDASDTAPPVLLEAGMEASDGVLLRFNEPVSAATAENVASYDLPGATIALATLDAAQPQLVHLTLTDDLPVAATLYTVTVTGVTDLAGNTIDTASADFLWKTVVFRGDMSYYLQSNSNPPDTFTVEGGTWPLTWELCDGAQTVDLGDGIHEWSGNFSAPGDGEGGASRTFEWKFVHNCTTYEPMPSNRTHTVTRDGSDTDVIEVFWGDVDPSQLTAHAIDVVFFVDLADLQPAPGAVVGVAGNVAPLDQAWPPAVVMADDGQGQDEAAGDLVYTAVVQFPAGSPRDVTYKFRVDEEYECFGQGDRDVYLNDAEFDVFGGDLGPLVLPVYTWDFCTISVSDVAVVFRLDATNVAHEGHSFAVNGTPNAAEPPTFSWDIPSLNPLADDGIAPDEVAGDGIYTRSVLFPAGSTMDIEYKYLMDGAYEGFLGNRSFGLDPYNFDAAGNPQVLQVDQLATPTGVGDLPAAALAAMVNVPNPFNPGTELRFTVHRAGPARLEVYDARGRLVRTLHAGVLAAGPHAFRWDGRDDAGREQPSGVYLARLTVDGRTGARKMLLVK